jgi:U4/U6.U5 tri-snRNP-associated protein 2
MSVSDSEDDYYSTRKKVKTDKKECPYMHTIDRFALDFDFEKVCSVTLSNSNVYACLVCGKYFGGRGKGTPAFTHSVEHEHNIFMHLADEKVYCLPEGYEADTGSDLSDIRSNLYPTYTSDSVSSLPSSALSLTGIPFHPGLVGLNQVRDSSYMNAALHVLCGVSPLRDYLLTKNISAKSVTGALSDVFKKICNSRNFKGVVSPHEFLHTVDIMSSNKFSAEFNDPIHFLKWLIDAIRTEGVVESSFGDVMDLRLPPVPVFKGEAIIPSVPLTELLERIDANMITSEYVLMRINRFEKNDFFVEKNNTIVRFPLRGVVMGQHAFSLVGVICHEGNKPGTGSYKAFVKYPQTGQWFECNGLKVTKVLPESVALVESYGLLWKREGGLR